MLVNDAIEYGWEPFRGVGDPDVRERRASPAAQAEQPPIVQAVGVFDLYQGPNLPAGKKSLAFRVVMQDTARTLTDAEADAAMAQLTELLAAKFGAKLRT